MKILEAKFRNAITMPGTTVGNTEKAMNQQGTTLTFLPKMRCLQVTRGDLHTLVPLENVLWMKAEPEPETEQKVPTK